MDDIDKYVAPPPPEAAEQIGTCELIVHGLEGVTPGSTIPCALYATKREDGRTTIQIAPLQPQHRRRHGSVRFIVERAELVALRESRR